MASQRVLVLALAVCALWGIVGTATSIYYYQQTMNYYQQMMTIRSSLAVVSVSIDYGNGTTRTYPEVHLFKDTALEALRAVANVSTTSYAGTAFVTAVNGVPQSSDKFWQFWVNGEAPMTAAEATLLQSGDRLEWKLAKSAFG